MLVGFENWEGSGGVEDDILFETVGCGGVLPGAHFGGERSGF